MVTHLKIQTSRERDEADTKTQTNTKILRKGYKRWYFLKRSSGKVLRPVSFATETKCFWDRFQDFFGTKLFLRPIPGLFRYQIFPIPVPIPSKKLQIPGTGTSHSRNISRNSVRATRNIDLFPPTPLSSWCGESWHGGGEVTSVATFMVNLICAMDT